MPKCETGLKCSDTPAYLKEQAADDVDRTGEVSDATKEEIAAWVDSQSDKSE